MAEKFDPYHKWLGIPPQEQPPNHYRLLGITLFESDPDVIEAAADRVMTQLRTYQAGSHSAFSQKLLNEVAAAKVCLLRPEKKRTYDMAIKATTQSRGSNGANEEWRLPDVSSGSPSRRSSGKSKRSSKSTGISPAHLILGAAVVAVALLAGVILLRPGSQAGIQKQHVAARGDSPATSSPASVEQTKSPANPVGEVHEDVTRKPDDMDAFSWTDILSLVDPSRDVTTGDWVRDGATVRVDAVGPEAYLTLPVAPAGSYEVLLEFTRTEGDDVVMLFFPVASTDCRLFFSGWSGAASGFAFIDDVEVGPPEGRSVQPGKLTNDHRYVLELKVLVAGDNVALNAKLDQKDYLHFDGRWASLRNDRHVPKRDRLILAANKSKVTFHTVKVRPLDSSGQVDLKNMERNLASAVSRQHKPPEIDGHSTQKPKQGNPRGASTPSENDFASLMIGSHDLAVENLNKSYPAERIRLELRQNGSFEDSVKHSGRWEATQERLRLSFSNGLKAEFERRNPMTFVCSDFRNEGGDLYRLTLRLPAVIGQLAAVDAPQRVEQTAAIEPSDKKLPVPTAEAQREAKKLVQQVHKKDIEEAKKEAQKLDLAQTLFKEAIETKDDPTTHFVLLSTAQDLAIAAGDVDLVLAIVHATADTFAIDRLEFEASALQKCVAVTPEKNVTLARRLDALSEEAVAEDRYDLAKQSGEAAVAAARKAKDKAVTKQVAARLKDIAERSKAFESAKVALATLKERPSDPVASLTAGKFLAFFKSNWDEGLPLLVAGSDPSLKEIAEKDLAGPITPSDQLSLADSWWAISEKTTGLVQRNLQGRALHWYNKCVGGLSGISKTKVEQRIASISISDIPWTDALAGIDLKKDVEGGNWRRVGTGLKVEAKGICRVGLAASPTDSYELRSDFTRVKGTDCVAFFFPVAKSHCRLILNGWNGKAGGIDAIEGKVCIDKQLATIRPSMLKVGTRYSVAISIHVTGEMCDIDAHIDGQRFVRYHGRWASLGVDFWRMPHPERLAIEATDSEVFFHSVQVQPLGNSGGLKVSDGPRPNRQSNAGSKKSKVPKTDWSRFDVERGTIAEDIAHLDRSGIIRTKDAFSGPLSIFVEAKTNHNNIRIGGFGGGAVIFNWEVKNDELRVHHPDGRSNARPTKPLKTDTWYKLIVQFRRNGMSVKVNDELVYEDNANLNLDTARPLWVGTTPDSLIDVKSIVIVPEQ